MKRKAKAWEEILKDVKPLTGKPNADVEEIKDVWKMVKLKATEERKARQSKTKTGGGPQQDLCPKTPKM